MHFTFTIFFAISIRFLLKQVYSNIIVTLAELNSQLKLFPRPTFENSTSKFN